MWKTSIVFKILDASLHDIVIRKIDELGWKPEVLHKSGLVFENVQDFGAELVKLSHPFVQKEFHVEHWRLLDLNLCNFHLTICLRVPIPRFHLHTPPVPLVGQIGQPGISSVPLVTQVGQSGMSSIPLVAQAGQVRRVKVLGMTDVCFLESVIFWTPTTSW